MSSLAVVARILGELGCRRRDVGQITVAAGMADDVVGRLLLGGIATIAAEGAPLLHGASPEESGVTLVRLDPEGHPPVDLTPITNVPRGRELEVTTVPWEHAAAEVGARRAWASA